MTAYEEFLRARQPALLRFAYLVSGDAAQAEDLVQDALAEIARRPAGSITAPEAYARRVITTRHVSGLRRLRRWRTYLSTARPQPVVATETDLALRDAVWQQIRRLPPRQRAVLVLRYDADLPDVDIARLLGCAESSVRSLATRAFATLRADDEIRDLAGREPLAKEDDRA